MRLPVGAVSGSVGLGQQVTNIVTSAADDPSVSQSVFTITEKAYLGLLFVESAF